MLDRLFASAESLECRSRIARTLRRVANVVDQLTARGFEVIALPMNIRGGSGGPVPMVARVPAD